MAAEERMLGDMMRELFINKKSGALYVSVVETSEDLIRIYFEKGEIYHLRYGTAVGNDCLDILEFYDLYSATFFDGITAPDATAKDLPSTREIISRITGFNTKVKAR
jgi:hypothetical protein